MRAPSPQPLEPEELRARQQRVLRLARGLGFVGRVEYRHVYSQSGGAQYGQGTQDSVDLLTVYAEAFERDANPEDFSLEALLAHERGHQLLVRHPRIAKVTGHISLSAEEILASLLGAIICSAESDREALFHKAAFELARHGDRIDSAVPRLQGLLRLLEELL